MFWRRRTQVKIEQPAEEPVVFNIPAEHAELWAKLAAFPIDNPVAEYPLSRRLADEQEWTHEYALRVVEEYRKFMFLCMVAGHVCTPSLHVDEAWHLHLLYTRSYWQELCWKTLGRLIHHQPSMGGTSEEKKYAGLYQQTLDSYAGFFGEPPVDIWGRRTSPRFPVQQQPPAPSEPDAAAARQLRASRTEADEHQLRMIREAAGKVC
jgi:hypothetical protein